MFEKFIYYLGYFCFVCLLSISICFIISAFKSKIQKIIKKYNDYCIGVNFGKINNKVALAFVNNDNKNNEKLQQLENYLNDNIKEYHKWIPLKISDVNTDELVKEFTSIANNKHMQ